LFVDSTNTHEPSDTIDTVIPHEPLEEPNRPVYATDIHLRESINHLTKANKELNTKYTLHQSADALAEQQDAEKLEIEKNQRGDETNGR
jgi:hypothetical protein